MVNFCLYKIPIIFALSKICRFSSQKIDIHRFTKAERTCHYNLFHYSDSCNHRNPPMPRAIHFLRKRIRKMNEDVKLDWRSDEEFLYEKNATKMYEISTNNGSAAQERESFSNVNLAEKIEIIEQWNSLIERGKELGMDFIAIPTKNITDLEEYILEYTMQLTEKVEYWQKNIQSNYAEFESICTDEQIV